MSEQQVVGTDDTFVCDETMEDVEQQLPNLGEALKARLVDLQTRASSPDGVVLTFVDTILEGTESVKLTKANWEFDPNRKPYPLRCQYEFTVMFQDDVNPEVFKRWGDPESPVGSQGSGLLNYLRADNLIPKRYPVEKNVLIPVPTESGEMEQFPFVDYIKSLNPFKYQPEEEEKGEDEQNEATSDAQPASPKQQEHATAPKKRSTPVGKDQQQSNTKKQDPDTAEQQPKKRGKPDSNKGKRPTNTSTDGIFEIFPTKSKSNTSEGQTGSKRGSKSDGSATSKRGGNKRKKPEHQEDGDDAIATPPKRVNRLSTDSSQTSANDSSSPLKKKVKFQVTEEDSALHTNKTLSKTKSIMSPPPKRGKTDTLFSKVKRQKDEESEDDEIVENIEDDALEGMIPVSDMTDEEVEDDGVEGKQSPVPQKKKSSSPTQKHAKESNSKRQPSAKQKAQKYDTERMIDRRIDFVNDVFDSMIQEGLILKDSESSRVTFFNIITNRIP